MSDPIFIVNVEAAIFKGDTWLLIERSAEEEHAAGTLSFVGGKVEDVNVANILEDTIHREIKEEVGIDIYNEIQYVKSSSFITNNGRHVINIVFLCEYKDGQPAALNSREVASVSWMTYDEVMNNPKTPIWTKENLKIAAEMRLKRQVTAHNYLYSSQEV